MNVQNIKRSHKKDVMKHFVDENIMKTWQAEHSASLYNMLLNAHSIIIIIGGNQYTCNNSV